MASETAMPDEPREHQALQETQDLIALPHLQETYKLIGQGKVRNLYEIDASTLLFVASDRISAFDVVLDSRIPGKGQLLTRLSAFWFSFLSRAIPTLRTHFLSLNVPANLPPATRSALTGRSMLVRPLRVFPIEAIVRGYLTGSAWTEYRARGTVHGMAMPAGLRESQAFATPLYTPSTKAAAATGQHDENVHPDEAARLVGGQYARRIEELALRLYAVASEHAAARGIIIADTKFEFGLDPATDEVVLVDEVLTPDSSRFWPARGYRVGQAQQSFDKQYVRDYLTRSGLKGRLGVRLPEDVVEMTRQKYEDAYQMLVGEPLEAT